MSLGRRSPSIGRALESAGPERRQSLGHCAAQDLVGEKAPKRGRERHPAVGRQNEDAIGARQRAYQRDFIRGHWAHADPRRGLAAHAGGGKFGDEGTGSLQKGIDASLDPGGVVSETHGGIDIIGADR